MKIKGFLSSRVITVANTPQEINAQGKGIVLYNDGSGVLYLGDANVTPSTGYPIEPNSGLFLELKEGARIYVVSDSAALVRVLEVF